MVSDRRRLPGLPVVAALAGGVHVLGLRTCGRMADRRWSLQVLGLRARTSPTAGTIFDRTRARGKKVLTGIAVKVREPKGIGRCRIAPLADASADSLDAFVTDHVELGAVVITDGWSGYAELERRGYIHDRRSQRAARARGEDPDELLPALDRVASLAKRWLLGTHQGIGR